MQLREIISLTTEVVRNVITQQLYLDRAIRDLFGHHHIIDQEARYTINTYSGFIFRNWFKLGGGRGEKISDIVKVAYSLKPSEFNTWSLEDPNADFPQWLIDIAAVEIGENWLRELKALSLTPNRDIRHNPLKIERLALINILSKEGITAEPIHGEPEAILITGGNDPFATRAFRQGLFEVQDRSSQKVAPFLISSYTKGLIVDACAGNGGKSLHLSHLLNNQGRILSMDIFERKLDELKRRAKNSGITNIETRHISSSKIIKRLENKADFLLLDVPCSGSGVLRRNPEAKLRLKPSDIENVRREQREILDRYSKMVSPGGTLVYATCSLLKSENRDQVNFFLNNHSNFTLLDDITLPPSLGGDGFYMAKLLKKNQ